MSVALDCNRYFDCHKLNAVFSDIPTGEQRNTEGKTNVAASSDNSILYKGICKEG